MSLHGDKTSLFSDNMTVNGDKAVMEDLRRSGLEAQPAKNPVQEWILARLFCGSRIIAGIQTGKCPGHRGPDASPNEA